ncbi:MAG: 30S ribosomal protein S3 [Candidatus Eremiobacteraeota bacterium]|nr:30S ribosomal protein S3 [Candidatus Eremiobacteraeota bacterium]
MGQKIHPIGLRLKITRGWDSRWFQDKKYTEWLHEDIKIRKFVRDRLKNAGVSHVEIERADRVDVIINTAKPGLVIGKKGAGIEDLRKNLNALINKPVKVTVQEIKTPELDASLVAENIVEQLEKRVAFRRAMKQAMSRSMKAGAKGIKVECSGRLAGAEIARSERVFEGKVPLHTLRADIDYAIREAFTTYGQIGVKVWIYRGDILPVVRTKKREEDDKTLSGIGREG